MRACGSPTRLARHRPCNEEPQVLRGDVPRASHPTDSEKELKAGPVRSGGLCTPAPHCGARSFQSGTPRCWHLPAQNKAAAVSSSSLHPTPGSLLAEVPFPYDICGSFPTPGFMICQLVEFPVVSVPRVLSFPSAVQILKLLTCRT